MKQLAYALALTGAFALAIPAAPARAYDETPDAIRAAMSAAEQAREHMRVAFGKTTLRNGQFLWKDGHGSEEVTRVVVDLATQMAYAYSGRELIGASTISSGNERHPTPIGIFPILEKKPMHRSKKYDDAPMPFMQRLDDYGIALHAGNLPGRPASHGCVRLPSQFASKLFSATRVGTEVLISDNA
jgi:lipoprotein-anchoring transpeptidase ErfK/SrfK